jgi:hypothetical protein
MIPNISIMMVVCFKNTIQIDEKKTLLPCAEFHENNEK